MKQTFKIINSTTSHENNVLRNKVKYYGLITLIKSILAIMIPECSEHVYYTEF